MIQKVGSETVLNNRYTPNKTSNPNFTGLGEVLLQGVQACERNPMLNVSVLDLATAIVPRTYIETKESNAFAGMEAFRRESSGLIVNCLIPSFVVMGLASLAQKPIMKGFNKSNLSNVWANEESLNIINKYLSTAKGEGSLKLQSAISNFLNDVTGVDGSEKISFKKFSDKLQDGIKDVAESTDKKSFKNGYKKIVEQTRMAEHIEYDGKTLSKNLEGLLDDFVKVHRSVEKEGIKSANDLSKYISKATKLVNWKSALGMAVIIPLAISMQPINRWITAKQSGVKGAPIYKDFTTNTNNELSPKEKAELLKQKIISVASMVGVMFLSMGGKFPKLSALQFKGIFPTMDQARIISTATFSSRMLASEDKNELREATIRDIATYSGLYFLGDYAAKGVATLIEKFSDVKLLNHLKKLPKDANIIDRTIHWIKDVSLKSSDEVLGRKARNLRSVCQLGNLAFSLIVLGLFIPLYTRTQTNKKREMELKQLASSINSSDGFLKDQIKNGSLTFKSFFNR